MIFTAGTGRFPAPSPDGSVGIHVVNWYAVAGVALCIVLLVWWWFEARRWRDIVVKKGKKPWE